MSLWLGVHSFDGSTTFIRWESVLFDATAREAIVRESGEQGKQARTWVAEPLLTLL